MPMLGYRPHQTLHQGFINSKTHANLIKTQTHSKL